MNQVETIYHGKIKQTLFDFYSLLATFALLFIYAIHIRLYYFLVSIW